LIPRGVGPSATPPSGDTPAFIGNFQSSAGIPEAIRERKPGSDRATADGAIGGRRLANIFALPILFAHRSVPAAPAQE